MCWTVDLSPFVPVTSKCMWKKKFEIKKRNIPKIKIDRKLWKKHRNYKTIIELDEEILNLPNA